MIRLVFTTPNREIIKFEIENKIVKYYDKMWKDGLLIMPMEDSMVKLQVKKMILSRKPSISATGLLIADANNGKNKEEYDKCISNEEVAELVKRDCRLKGLKEITK